MNFQTIIPILFSSDIDASIKYYTEVLGFKTSWTWDKPPAFGGVHFNDIVIYFCKDGQGQKGTWLAINLDDVDAYHDLIKSKGAKVISPPKSYEWGMREILVEDPDGHRIRFGHGISVHGKSESQMPDNILIVAAEPTRNELRELIRSVGWARAGEQENAVQNTGNHAHVVIAKNKVNDETIGCAFLISDNAGFYYIKNVIVHPAWQGKRIGTALVKHLDEWLQMNAPEDSTVALHTGPGLASFYRHFGFSTSFSMQKKITRSKSF